MGLAVAISLVLVIGSVPMKEQTWAQQRGLILPEPADKPAPTNNTNSTSGASNVTVKSAPNDSNMISDEPDKDKDKEVPKSSSNLTGTETQQEESSEKQSQQQDDGQ